MTEDDDGFMEFEEPPVSNKLERMSDSLLEIGAKKDGLERARERAAERLSGMTGQVMDAMEMALQSEDEGIRVKAAMGLLDRLVPRMRARNDALEEVIEIVPESRKRLLEDIEEEFKKKMKKGDEDG